MCAGVVAVIVVGLTTTTAVAALPAPRSAKATLAGARKLVPVIVTAVPPVAGPLTGAMVLTVGAGLPTTGKRHS